MTNNRTFITISCYIDNLSIKFNQTVIFHDKFPLYKNEKQFFYSFYYLIVVMRLLIQNAIIRSYYSTAHIGQ